MSIDDKLRKIVNTLTAQLEGKYHKQVADIAIAQIKQVFAEEGYIQVMQPKEAMTEIDLETFTNAQYIKPTPVMTGREFYERFEREAPMSTESHVFEAARRAAGLEEKTE